MYNGYMKKNTRLFLKTSLYGLGTLVAATMFWRMELFATLIIAGIGVVMMTSGDQKERMLYITCAILGSIAEMIAIYFGAWKYATPTVFGIPMWLPFVWGNAALYIVRMNRVINN